jgi:hypothetical protein
MTLIDSEHLPILVLVFTTIIGPVIAYWMQEGRIAILKVGLEKSSLQLEKNAQIIRMFSSLNTSLSEYWVMQEELMKLPPSGPGTSYAALMTRQQKTQEMDVKVEEIVQIRIIISELTGKNTEEIGRFYPPHAPTNVTIQ